MTYPDDLRYHAEDTWAREEPGGLVRVGITHFAQDQLGEIVFVDVPSVGQELVAGEAFGEIESTKTVSDLHAPVSGTVTEGNTALEDDPALINGDPYGDGWIALVQPSEALPDDLLDASAYRAKVEDA